MALKVHEHSIIRGRSGHVRHSHPGGDAPHEHPDTGPADFGFSNKTTLRPNGEQFLLVAVDPASLVFDVYVLDSAIHASRHDGKLHSEAECDGLCGDPVMPAARRMERAFGMTARYHDLRTRAAQ